MIWNAGYAPRMGPFMSARLHGLPSGTSARIGRASRRSGGGFRADSPDAPTPDDTPRCSHRHAEWVVTAHRDRGVPPVAVHVDHACIVEPAQQRGGEQQGSSRAFDPPVAAEPRARHLRSRTSGGSVHLGRRRGRVRGDAGLRRGRHAARGAARGVAFGPGCRSRMRCAVTVSGEWVCTPRRPTQAAGRTCRPASSGTRPAGT